MIKTMLHYIKTGETQWGNEGLFVEWAENPDLWIWADFETADPQHETELFIETFNLHSLAIADAQREPHSPKTRSVR